MHTLLFYLLLFLTAPFMIKAQASGFSTALLPASTRLIQAFYQQETGRRVPADVVELKKDQNEAILFLYPGAYEIVYLNESGRILMTKPISIN